MRHISFNSHSLITAHVPYERVVRNADLDNFATHRRSVLRAGAGMGVSVFRTDNLSLILLLEQPGPPCSLQGGRHGCSFH